MIAGEWEELDTGIMPLRELLLVWSAAFGAVSNR